MAGLWPWLVVAGAGALHGLNPSTGWGLATACGLRSRDRRQALGALLPIAVGHAVSIAIVAAMVALGLSSAGLPLQLLSGALLLGAVLLRLSHHGTPRLRARAGRTGLALWSFMVSTAHGTGMMLVPALVPLCLSSSPAREITASGSLLLALAAVAVHMAAMLAVTAAVAVGACGVVSRWRGLAQRMPWARSGRPPVAARYHRHLDRPAERGGEGGGGDVVRWMPGTAFAVEPLFG